MKRVAAIVTAAVLVAAGGTTAFAYASGPDVAIEERAPTKPITGSQAPTFIRSGGHVVPVASGDDRRNEPDPTPPRSREQEPPQPLVGGRYDEGVGATDHGSGRGGRDEDDRRGRSDNRDRDDRDRDDRDRDDRDRDDRDRDDRSGLSDDGGDRGADDRSGHSDDRDRDDRARDDRARDDGGRDDRSDPGDDLGDRDGDRRGRSDDRDDRRDRVDRVDRVDRDDRRDHDKSGR